MQINFTKMHGLGNDFVVIDMISQHAQLTPDIAKRIADRHFGIGCDQILLVEKSTDPTIDFRFRIFNADGGEVAHCGNGARCFARFVFEKKLTDKKDIAVEMISGIIHLSIKPDNQVTVNMGPPRFEPHDVPFTADARQPSYNLEVDGKNISVGVVSMGNPHAVVVVDDVSTAPVSLLGPLLERHPRFPQRANIGFMQIVTKDRIRLRVFERGSGETLACGTGACAAVAVGHAQNLLNNDVTVSLPGGDLQIRWKGDDHPVWMTGPATFVFEGTIKL